MAIASGAAARLGVFAALAAPCTIDELAQRVSAAPRRLRALVELLVAGGRLELAGDVLSVGAPGVEDPRGARVIEQVIRRDRAFDRALDSWSLQLDASVLDVRPLLSLGATERALDAIDGLADCAVFLDAGGGLGDATRAFLARSGGRAVLVDRPPIIEAARRHLAPLGDRVTFVAADLRTAEIPRSDVAYLSNVLHLCSEPDGDAILGALARSSERVIVRDVALDDDRGGPIVALAFAFVSAILGDGTVNTSVHMKKRLETSGVGTVEILRPEGAEWVLAKGRK